jgi:hypothetical protein
MAGDHRRPPAPPRNRTSTSWMRFPAPTRSSAGRPCAGASAAGSRGVPGSSTSEPVGADGSAPQAAPGRRAAGVVVDAGGVAPKVRGVTPGSRSPWRLPTDSRAAPAPGYGAAPGRRTTRPQRPPPTKASKRRRIVALRQAGPLVTAQPTSGVPRGRQSTARGELHVRVQTGPLVMQARSRRALLDVRDSLDLVRLASAHGRARSVRR